jgi:hypothetical protein
MERPDIRPQLRELLDWYDDVLTRVQAGALVAPGEERKLRTEADQVRELLALLNTDEAPVERESDLPSV